MSESSDKLIAVSKRQPSQRRRRPRQVEKAAQTPVKKQQAGVARGESVALTRPNNQNIIPPALLSEGRRPRSKIMMPTAVKPIPKSQVKPQPGTVKFKTVRIPKPGRPRIDRRASRKTRLKPMARAILYTLRLLIVGIGLGAIVGTLLSVLDPANRITTSSSSPSQANVGQSPTNSSVTASSLYLSQEIIPLKTTVQNLAAANPNLIPGVFMVDLDTGAYVDINSTASFPAASTIKVPILIAFFQDVDAGKIRLDEMLTMQQEMVATGSGNLRANPVGSQYTALDIATKMITISDNTATNMIIARLGGQEVLNERFRSWGLTTTIIRSPLPDLQGTNTTSPRELGNLIAAVNQGNVISMRSRDLMLDIMRRTQRNNLLPSGLGEGAKSYHKTGDIATMLADAGLIDLLTGKRYIAAVMVQRPNNDPSAQKLISDISSAAYQHFSQTAVTPSTPTNNLPPNSYQQPSQPFIQPVPNGTVNNAPMGTYPAPVTTPQSYPPQ